MSNNPYYGRKGSPTDIVFRFLKSDGEYDYPVVVSTPTEVSLNKGISLTEIMTTGRTGEMVLADQLINERKPTIQLTFPLFNPETLGLLEGYKPETVVGAEETWHSWGPFQVGKQLYDAATSGQEGFGVTAQPAGASASYLDEYGVSQEVDATVAYSAVSAPAGPAEVGIGANMALHFSADLVGKYVALRVPNNLASITKLSTTVRDTCQIELTGVTRELKVWYLKIFRAVLKADEGDINLGADQQLQLTYSINKGDDPCSKPYQFEWLPQQRIC